MPILFVNFSHYQEFNNSENIDSLIQCLIKLNYNNFHILYIYISNEENNKEHIKLINTDKYKTIYHINNIQYESSNKLDTIFNLIINTHFNINNLISKDEIDNLLKNNNLV